MPLSCFSWCHSAKENAVKEIDLSNSALNDVPNSIFLHERTLDSLFLSSNRIQDLPLPLFYCQNLQFLNLSDNDIATIPAAISSLIHLKTLDLNRNCVEEVTESIKGCKKLSSLNLSMNPLRGFPEPVTQLVGLEELYLNDAGLDYLPANVGRLVRLRVLELRDNRLAALPRAIARLARLARLDLGQNDFTILPDVVGELVELEELWLDLNGMAETPTFLGHLQKLTHLDISENNLEEVTASVGECRFLTELTLTSNDIQRLPVTIGQIDHLVTLKLEVNDLTSLPSSIGDLVSLEELYVSSNRIEALPSTIGLLRKLICLGLDSNKLQYLPPEMGSCASLRVLTAQNNRLRWLPAELGSLTRLAVLSLSGNCLTHLPMSLLKLSQLKALWLAANQSQPLTPLVKTYEPECAANVLTCYLLPQTPSDRQLSASSYEADNQTVSVNYKQKTSERPKIRFCINPITERQNVLFRAPTPYPKKLRELAKTARAIASHAPPPASSPPQREEVEPELDSEPVVVGVSGTNAALDQVRTAVVKRQAPPQPPLPPSPAPSPSLHLSPATREERGLEGEEGGLRRPVPPPYHVAAAFSKQASRFQSEPTGQNHRGGGGGVGGGGGERRPDIDTEALWSLKDELRQRLPPAESQLAQSELSLREDREEQGHSSDVDSAFVDNDKRLEPSHSPPDDGTYSAYPGIVIAETPEPFDSSSYPISKVNSWLSSKTKSPSSIENGCEFINMYPCENNGSFRNDSNANDKPLEEAADKQEELITSSIVTRPSKLPWLFGVHKNPKVVEVTINNSGTDLGFDITVLSSGVFVRSVSGSGATALRPGDKILQVEGADASAHARSNRQARALLAACHPPFTVLVSRQP